MGIVIIRHLFADHNRYVRVLGAASWRAASNPRRDQYWRSSTT